MRILKGSKRGRLEANGDEVLDQDRELETQQVAKETKQESESTPPEVEQKATGKKKPAATSKYNLLLQELVRDTNFASDVWGNTVMGSLFLEVMGSLCLHELQKNGSLSNQVRKMLINAVTDESNADQKIQQLMFHLWMEAKNAKSVVA